MCHVWCCIDFNESTHMTKHYALSTKVAYLEQFHESCLTQAAFCRQHGLVFKTFNKWLKDATLTQNDTQQVKSPFQNRVGTVTANQATFIPVDLKDDDVCACLHQPLKRNCSFTSPRSSPTNVSHQSVLGFKTNRFSLDISLDLGSDYVSAPLFL